MTGKIRWLVGGVVVAALLLVGFAGTALADPEDVPSGPWYGQMEEMHEWCWGPNGPMGGGLSVGLGYGQLEQVADLLGISVDDLVAQRQAGTSFADIAQAKGVELQTIIDALTAPVKENLQLRVEDGAITQAQADAFLTARQDALKSVLEGTSTPPTNTRGYGRGGFGKMMGGGMMGGYGGMMGGGGSGFRTR